jgi:hypothetical protein
MKNRLFVLAALFALASLVAFGAAIDGKWMSEAQGKGGPQTLTLKADGMKLTGSLDAGRGGAVDIANGKIEGDKVSFEVTRPGRDGAAQTTKYSGTVAGSDLKLSFDRGRGPQDVVFKKQ